MNIRSKICVFSIGHSNHSWEKFSALLHTVKIKTIVDVRSYPRSRFAHFNREPLTARLASENIDYYFWGNELGGRPKADVSLDYETTARSPEFIDALNRVVELAGQVRTAMLCSEHEPLACHRCLLLGRSLAEDGIAVQHVLRDGRIETHKDAEDRLIAMTRKRAGELLTIPAERLALAYRIQAQFLLRKPK